MIPERSRYIGDEDPILIWWSVNGTLVNFSSGYTFTAKLTTVAAPTTTIFTKSTGFTGAAGSGTAKDGTPNLTVAWSTTTELNSLTAAGTYFLEIVALKVSDSSQSTYRMKLQMLPRLGS